MGLVVTGILQNGDIKALETSLKDAGLPLDPIQLISGEDSTEGVARRQVGPRIMTGDHAAYVPGINNSGVGLSYFRNESLSDRLGDLEIPDSEVENYVEALEAGRSIVAYFAKPDSIEQELAEVVRDPGSATGTLGHGPGECERHARPRQPIERIGAPGQSRVDEHIRHGEMGSAVACPHLVVVGDDQIPAVGLGDLCRFDGGDAAVDGDDELRPSLANLRHRVGVQAVTLFQAMGDVVMNIRAQHAQRVP